MKAKRNQGFTLIELLVVIVIIGILAGSLFGPVTNALQSAQRSGMMQRGIQIVRAINSADMSGRYESLAWPADENQDLKPSESLTGPDMYQNFTSTAAYFQEALYVTESDVNRRNRLKVLKDIEPSTLVAPGVTAAAGNTINDNNCAWVIAKNTRNAPAKTPVLVSRNINCSTLASTAGNDTSADAETLLTTAQPFGQNGCVLIYKDNSGKDFDAGNVYAKAMIFEAVGSDNLTSIEQGDDAFEFLQSGSSN